MLDELLHFFSGYGPLEIDAVGHPTDATLKVATAALLWETCLADDQLDQIEVDKLSEIMRNAFFISEKEVELISAICQAERSREKLDEFVQLINDNFDDQQRQKIVEYAAELAKASHDVNIAEGVVCDVMRQRLNLGADQDNDEA